MTAPAIDVLQLVVSGAPRTKKNSGQGVITRSAGGGQPCPKCRTPLRVRVFPSKAWREWAKLAVIRIPGNEVDRFWIINEKPYLGGVTGAQLWTPLATPMNCRAVFYRDRNAGDFIGYVQGLADLLEERGVIANDVLLATWNGSHLAIDRDNPRVELSLEPITEEHA